MSRLGDDPDRLLREMRDAVEAAEDAVTDDEQAYQWSLAGGRAAMLDRHISSGGALPQAWQVRA